MRCKNANSNLQYLKNKLATENPMKKLFDPNSMDERLKVPNDTYTKMQNSIPILTCHEH